MADPLTSAIASKVANEAVDSVWHQIGYIWNYKSNIAELQQHLRKLEAQRQSMLHSMDEARRNCEEIEDTATIWLKSADEAIEAAEEIVKGNGNSKKSCLMGCCPNMKARHQFSRKAKKETLSVAQVQEDRNSIHKIGHRVDVQTIEPVKKYEALHSRMEVLEDIVRALKDDDVNLIGVYGLGGVGKTTLAKQQVVAQVKEEGIFKTVATVNVTHTWKLSKVQQDIADWLGLKFDIESTEVRAALLRERLKKEKKVLIVLDDIWEKIELEKIGIPNSEDHKGCKILMTSRDQSILMSMGVQSHFRLHALLKEEAWQLFEKNAGDIKPNFRSTAIEVARRCAGLPVLLLVVAASLRDKKDLCEWEDALEQLQKFDGKGMEAQVYSGLELSYKFLSDDQKSLLVLCAQLSGNTDIIDLVKYAMGLDLFGRCTTIKVLRNRLNRIVNDLKRSCLLLEDDDDNCVTMHDVVRSFSTAIASKQYHVFTVTSETELEEWPEKDAFERFTAISFPFCKIPDLPQVLESPKLESFIFYNDDPLLKIPDKLFSRTKKLKLVDLSDMNLLPLPSSLGNLQNVQTLCLDRCVLEDISAIGQLNKLQVLSLMGSNIVELPMETRNLTCLQLLDLSNCQRLEVIPPGIITCLRKLEELYMMDSFVQWKDEGRTSKTNNASLSELKTLCKLTNLEIHITDAKMMTVDLFHRKLESFKILIGDNWDYDGNHGISKMLKLKLNDGFALKRVKVLLKESDDLYLDDLKGVENVVPKLESEGFPELKHLQIQNCHEMQFIIDSSRMGDIIIITFPIIESLSLLNLNKLEKICNGPYATSSFNSLRKLMVRNCNALKNLFSSSTFRCLVQLQELNVSQCEILNEIVSLTNADETIKLTQLHTLTLEDLSQLEGFSSPTYKTSGEILPVDEIENLFCKKIQFPNLVELKLSSINVEKIWHNRSIEFCPFDKLTTLIVQGCRNLASVLISSMVRSLLQLKQFEICDCKSMEEVITTEGETEEEIIFPKLIYLKLKGLPELVKFCRSNLIKCPSMTTLRIEDCPRLQNFASTSNGVAQQQDSSPLFDEKVDFPNLEEMVISGVHEMKVIWGNELREDSFCKLKQLKVEAAEELVLIFPPNLELMTRFKNLERLDIYSCDALTEVFDIRAIKDLKVERGGVTATQLKTLWVENTPNLKHLWNQDPEGVVDFHNLSSVDIRGCPSLKSVFPVSVATSLMNLEILYVYDSAIKEIIAAGDHEERIQGAPVFEFPQLKDLRLRILPQLETFYPGTYTSEWPALQKVYITQCYQFHLLSLFHEKLEIIPNLEELVLNGKEVKMIRDGQLPVELFHKLKVVEFNLYDEESAVFPYDLLQKFSNVETLLVMASELKELFPQEVFVGDEKHHSLTRMRSLELWWLPNLKTIWNQVVQTLESLYLIGCDNLIILAPSSASFQSLTSLDIDECKGLVSIVTFSTAASLMQLEKLRVSKCDQVKVIVSDEGDETTNEINFIKLETLVLNCLPSLTTFCSGDHNFKFPSLTKVVVNQCPKMEFFSKGVSTTPLVKRVEKTEEEDIGDWLGSLDSSMQFLYKNMVGFQGMENLKLSEFSNLKDKWHNELPVEIFCDLNSLVIDEVAFFSYAIPSNLLEHLNKLEKLEVNNCELLEEVFDLQGLGDEAQEQRGLLSKLNRFHLINLPSVRQVWNEHPQRILNFNHLKSLKVHNCCSLRMIFTPCMTRGLVQLQEMEVKNCVSVEEIISKGAEEDDMIIFPQLNTLVLDSLPKLTVFHPGRGNVQCPSLGKMRVMDCPKIEVFTSSDYEEPEPIKYDFFQKVVFPNIKDLKLSLVQINNKQQLGMSAFVENLTSLNIDSCGNLKYLFSSSMVKGFVHLKTLELCNCKLMEEIIHMEKSEKMGDIVLPKLEFLNLKNLQQLAQFCTGNLIECVGLTRLWIENCPELGAFISNSAISPKIVNSTLFDEKVDFPNLEILKLSGVHGLKVIWGNELREDSFCELKQLKVHDAKAVVKVFPPDLELMTRFQNLGRLDIRGCDALTEVFDIRALKDVKIERGDVTATQLKILLVKNTPNLKHVWNEDPKGIFYFHNLSNVDIRECTSLKSVFPASVAKGLAHLEKLWVCDSAIKEIIAAGDDEEQIQLDSTVFEFPQLKELHLRRLPQLETFYPAENHTSEWPALKQLYITQCYQFHLPILSFKEIIPDLEELSLNGKEVRMIREGQLPVELFCTLKVVEFNFFNEKSAVFPYDLLHIFLNLETLKVQRSNFKELFPSQGGVLVYEELILTRIHSLKLYHLPNLKMIGNQVLQTLETLYIQGCDNLIILAPSSASFQSLTSLDVEECKGLVSLVTSSTAKSLIHLQKLKVRNCDRVEVIISDEADETMDEINFIKLEILELYCLPSLTNFCSGNHSFKFPSLTKVIVNQCPKMEFFSKGVSSTPLLERVRKMEEEDTEEEETEEEDADEEDTEEEDTEEEEIGDCQEDTEKEDTEEEEIGDCQEDTEKEDTEEEEEEEEDTEEEDTEEEDTEEEEIGDWLGNLNSTLQFLYKNMVGFQGMQHLKLSEFSDLEEKWHSELPLEIFCDLNSLVIDDVAFSSHAIPSNLLEYLNKLEKLEVNNCELLENVFDLQGLSDEAQEERRILSKLKEFHLIDLPRLRQVWNDHPRQILNFNHLKSLKVHNCCSLRMIFTPSMTLGLVQLQEMEVKNCVLVEEIISKGVEEDDIISFPQLNSLVLDSLPKLTVFHPRRGIVQCPALEKISVMDCPKIEVFTSSDDEEPEPIKFGGNSIFFGKVKYRSIKQLRVDWSNNIKKIWDGELAATHKFFYGLKVLELNHFPVEYSTFPSRFLERSCNLEELVVSDASFDEIFSQEVTINIEKESSKDVTRLRRLTLSKLPQLRHLIKDQNERDSLMQHLEALEVSECTKLIFLVPSSISFQNLKTLKVSKCHGLLYLTTSSTARSLSQLTRLIITECEMLEEVVASEGDEIETETVFSQLKHLELHSLPELARFCSGNETFNFPSLEEVIVRECPKMEIFVRGELSAPNLECVQTTEDEWCWDGSLSATIQKLFKETNDRKVEEH